MGFEGMCFDDLTDSGLIEFLQVVCQTWDWLRIAKLVDFESQKLAVVKAMVEATKCEVIIRKLQADAARVGIDV